MHVCVYFISFAAANTTFGFTTTDVRVREGQDTFVHICIIQLSAGPLMEPITLQLTFIDKEGENVINIIVHYVFLIQE